MELEFDADELVALSLLPASPSGELSARVLKAHGRQLALVADGFSAPAGTAVQVRSRRYMVLGELSPVQTHGNFVQIKIRHALALSDIQQMRKRWT